MLKDIMISGIFKTFFLMGYRTYTPISSGEHNPSAEIRARTLRGAAIPEDAEKNIGRRRMGSTYKTVSFHLLFHAVER
jgi:hypothetical protein